MSQQRVISADTLGDLGGGAARAIINSEIQKAIADVIDRGDEDEKPRKVVIELELRKSRKEPDVFVSVRAQAKLPPRQSPTTHAMEMGQDEDAKLFFSPRFAHEPDQADLFEGE